MISDEKITPKYPVQSVEKSLEILELLSGNKYNGGISISELSSELGLGKSTVHRIVETLEAKGYLNQDIQTKDYLLSWKLFELGNTIPRKRNLFNIDGRILQELCDKFQETINIGVRENDCVVTINKISSSNVLIANLQLGARESLHATAMGKALISEMTKEEIVDLLGEGPYDSFTSKTIKDINQLMEDITFSNERGYCLDSEEFSPGLTCISVPLRNYANEIIAAISVSGATVRMTDKKIEKVSEELKIVKKHISNFLGWQDSL